MLKLLPALVLIFAANAALAQDAAIGNETPAADQASDKAVSAKAVETTTAEKKDDVFTPPAGFVTKKRGALTLYCKRDRETGTRFSTEKCYDENQVREYLITLEQQKRDIDRIRSTCATAAVCSKT
jgi:hypothetical protein